MTAAEAIRDLIAPLLPGYVQQYGAWRDTPGAKTQRYAVLKPAGGARADVVRRPEFTLTLVGVDGGDSLETAAHAEAIVEAMRVSSGGLVFLHPAEPVFMPTSDGRPVFEIAVSAITH